MECQREAKQSVFEYQIILYRQNHRRKYARREKRPSHSRMTVPVPRPHPELTIAPPRPPNGIYIQTASAGVIAQRSRDGRAEEGDGGGEEEEEDEEE